VFRKTNKQTINKNMRLSQVSVLAVVVLLTVAAATASARTPARHVGAGWKQLPASVLPPRELSVPLTLFLRQRNLQELESLVHAVSSPRSGRYGDYLSLDQLTELIAPSSESLEQISAFLLVCSLPCVCVCVCVLCLLFVCL
jgi:subtilase family serine protease